MSWHYSRVLVEAYSAASSSDGNACAPLSATNTQETSSLHGKTMDVSTRSQSGMTCSPSTESLGVAWWILSLAASRAKTFQSQEVARDLTATVAVCGLKWPESLAKLHPDECLWKTRQCLLFEDSGESLETWPKWGSTQGTEFWEATPPGAVRMESASGYSLMRPIASDGLRHKFKLKSLIRKNHQDGNLSEQLARVYQKKLTPLASEILMGWPETWTDCDASATASVQSWCVSHGKF